MAPLNVLRIRAVVKRLAVGGERDVCRRFDHPVGRRQQHGLRAWLQTEAVITIPLVRLLRTSDPSATSCPTSATSCPTSATATARAVEDQMVAGQLVIRQRGEPVARHSMPDLTRGVVRDVAAPKR